ncbi:Glyoxalase-like domain-containing protein [Micromonospora viridifaciens]|uniref:Glyoxalase-like domain-containing protein n=1 Tax=Micromonospora viridifaciens TaxID=1881 RepID=A0A1C4YFT4_MICVI|nr:Glyoxalase-like domain-containing protein [Micromonospora viridifaciens]
MRRANNRVSVERVTIDLFAGLPVSDFQRALIWYERLLGNEPAFLPNATEAVWELAEHRYLYIEELPERAGHALHTVFVDDLDQRVESIAGRGITPASRETYGNGVRKVIYRDPDGNEIGFGGAPLE